jgi:hypothetical protein
MPLLVLLLLPIFLDGCANGATDGDEVVVFGRGATDDAIAGPTVLGIPHIRASVVLTTLRLGLLGLHIFALTSGDMVVLLGELGVDGGDIVGEDVC